VILLLIIIFGIYLALSSSAINELQMGFGDMHSLYIIKRLSQGVDMFEGINMQYGPIFYVIGSNLTSLGLTYSSLKVFMLLISIGNGILIFLISRKIFKDERISLLSTIIYLFMPIHYGFAPMFHPDIIAVFFFLIAMYFLLLTRKKHFVIAGIFSAIAFFTKLPVLPLTIAPMLYFLINKKKNGIIYTITFVALLFSALVYVNEVSPENDNFQMYIEGILQSPDLSTWKISQVVLAEGFVYLIGIIGLIIHLKKTGKQSLLSFIALSTPLSFATILYWGVGSYVISYSEPYIAIFASYFIFLIIDNWKTKKFKIENKIIAGLVIGVIFFQFSVFDWPSNERLTDWRGNGWTKTYDDMAILHSELLEKYTKKGDIVFASPMALYNAERVFPHDDPYPYVIHEKIRLGFESGEEKLEDLKNMIKNKEIKMLIEFGSKEYNEENFYPFYLKSFQEILEQNYDIFQEKDVYYYLPQK